MVNVGFTPNLGFVYFGDIVCGRCASVHKRVLGPPNHNISKVKSLTLDNWTEEQINQLRRIGNKKAKRNGIRREYPFHMMGMTMSVPSNNTLETSTLRVNFATMVLIIPSMMTGRVSLVMQIKAARIHNEH